LVFIKIGVYKFFEWCWKREKALCKKVVQEGACHDPGFYQILGDFFFVFVLLEMIEISQGFKNF
jgi:hypothetical protein